MQIKRDFLYKKYRIESGRNGRRASEYRREQDTRIEAERAGGAADNMDTDILCGTSQSTGPKEKRGSDAPRT